jgi:predicted HTH domain antitoxin
METQKSKTLIMEMPTGAFSALEQSADEFAQSMRLAAAAKWYEKGMIYQEKAAEIAGLCREDFLMALAKFDVSPFQYSAEEVLREAGYDI